MTRLLLLAGGARRGCAADRKKRRAATTDEHHATTTTHGRAANAPTGRRRAPKAAGSTAAAAAHGMLLLVAVAALPRVRLLLALRLRLLLVVARCAADDDSASSHYHAAAPLRPAFPICASSAPPLLLLLLLHPAPVHSTPALVPIRVVPPSHPPAHGWVLIRTPAVHPRLLPRRLRLPRPAPVLRLPVLPLLPGLGAPKEQNEARGADFAERRADLQAVGEAIEDRGVLRGAAEGEGRQEDQRHDEEQHQEEHLAIFVCCGGRGGREGLSAMNNVRGAGHARVAVDGPCAWVRYGVDRVLLLTTMFASCG